MKLNKQFPFRPIFRKFLDEYTQCETYWYIPKARSLNKDNLFFMKDVLTVIFNEFLGHIWSRDTQKELLETLTERELLNPRKTDGTVADRTALPRILIKLCATLGLLYIKNKREIVITDAGLDIIATNSETVLQDIIEKQIFKYQYPNPSVTGSYNQIFEGILPQIFLLQVITRCNNEISTLEYELFVNLAKSQDDVDRVVNYIQHWRDLSEDEQNTLLDIVKKIPMKIHYHSVEQEDDEFEEEELEPIRFQRIKLNGSYQRAFFCFTRHLEVSQKKIVCLNPDHIQNILNGISLKIPTFSVLEDWFSYLGDTTQVPSLFNYLAIEIEKAKTDEEIRNIEELIVLNREKLSEDESEEIQRRQIEKDIESFYINNLDLLEEGLTLLEDGRQYITPIGRIDLLCRARDNSFVVVEIKAIEARDSVFGQILRYIGWIHRNIPEAQNNVRGIILAKQFGDKARYSRIGLLKDNASQFIKFKEHNFDVSNLE